MAFGAFTAIFFVTGLTQPATAACLANGPGVEMKGPERTSLKVLLDIQQRPIEVSSPFRVKIAACASVGTPIKRLSINATMPRHGHGMNYQPTLTKVDGSHYLATGLLFHMPGLWRIEVSAYRAGETERFFYDVEVK